VLRVASRVTVLRDGRIVASRAVAGLNEDSLVEMIAGAQVERATRSAPTRTTTTPLLEVSGLSGQGVHRASFQVRPGEVVGIAGVLGSGRSELLQLLYGYSRPSAGTIRIDGSAVELRSPREAIAQGIVLVPEDRMGYAAFPDQSVRHNLSASRVAAYWSKLRLRKRRETADAKRAVSQYRISTASVRSPFVALSGGNQQKVIFARWLECRPRLLLLDEPTQGVDAQAREQLYGLVNEAMAAGAGALVVASDLEELVRVCDRAIVMVRGRIVTEMSGDDLVAERLTQTAHDLSQTAHDIAGVG
jgi:ribose transport system ATP-binding protein